MPDKTLPDFDSGTVQAETRKGTITVSVERNYKHNGPLQIPPVDIIVAPGRRGGDVQKGLQRVQAMANRGRNQNQNQNLQGADPALVQILQLM